MESKKFYSEVGTVLSGVRAMGAWTSEKISPDQRIYLEHRSTQRYGFTLVTRALRRGEDGTPTTEYILGPTAVVSAYLKAWESCVQGRIGVGTYLIISGALYGYPPEETAKWAATNENGAICACSQCIPNHTAQQGMGV